MRVRVFALAITALILGSEPAFSAGAATCNFYAREAVAKAEGMQAMGCGYEADDPRWTTDRNAHARWCRAAAQGTVDEESTRRRGLMRLCQICRAYADLAAARAADNVNLKCQSSGPRWNINAAAHFAWCMGLRQPEGTNDATSYKAAATNLENAVARETGIRTQTITICALRAPRP